MLTKISKNFRPAPFLGALVLSVGLADISAAKEDKADSGDKMKSEAPAWPEKLADYKLTGKSELCLSLVSIQNSRVIDDQHILFDVPGKKDYVNVLPHRCIGLNSTRAFSFETSLSKLCNTDIIYVVDTIGSMLETRGSCGLGKFQQVEKTEKPKPEMKKGDNPG